MTTAEHVAQLLDADRIAHDKDDARHEPEQQPCVLTSEQMAAVDEMAGIV